MAELETLPVESRIVALEDLDKLWRPIMVLSRCLGVFPFVDVHSVRVVSWWRNPWIFFSIFTICVSSVLLVFHTVLLYGLFLLTLEYWLNDVARFLFNCVFLLYVALSTATFIYYLNCKTYFNDLCQLWSSLQFDRKTAIKLNAAIEHKTKCILAWSVFGIAIYICAILAIFLSTGNYRPQGVGLILPLSFLLWLFSANALLIGLFCTVCSTINCLIKAFSQDLEAKVTKESLDLYVQWFREDFMKVIDFVEVSNQLFGNFLGFCITSFLIHTCCITYLTFPLTFDNFLSLAGDVVFLVEGFAVIVIVCLMAGEVSEQGRLPYRILLKLELSESASNNQIQALILLLDMSRNVQANMNMFGIIPITKRILPMLFGLYLSYVFLLYTFPQGSAKKIISPEANITESL